MSDNFYRRLSLIFGFLVIGAIFAMQTFVANIEIKDLDLWLHIGTGRYIVENGYVPSVDFLSCTIAGKPWVNHEWLFQIIVYIIHKFSGPDGLIFMQLVVVSLTGLLLLLLGYNQKRQFFCILAFLFLSLIYQMRFTIRPDLFSLLFFVIYMMLLSIFLKNKWSLAIAFVVQVLWTNMHGFFFFGPLLILIALISEWMRRHIRLPWEWNRTGKLDDIEYKNAKWMFVLSFVACLINPLTFKGAWYPVSVFLQISGDSAIFFHHILELKRPITMATLWDGGEYQQYKIMILITLVSFIFNRRKIDISVLIVWGVFLLFSLTAIRNIVYFSFAAFLVFMNNAASLTLRDVFPIRIEDRKFIYVTTLALKIFLLVWVVNYIVDASSHGYFDFEKYERKSEFGGVSQRNFPDKAVDFLVENGIRGNMFNEFNSGAYVVGRCFPDIKVYIDGRTEVYGPEFFKHYLKIVHDQDVNVFKEELRKYDISIILINTVRGEGPENILKFLKENDEWKLVYLNYDGLIFLKNEEKFRDVIVKHEIDPEQWIVHGLDEYRLGSRKVVPYYHINRAYSLEALGYPDAAVAEARAALDIYPGYPEAFALIAQVHAERNETEEAFHYFRLALTYNSSSREIRTNLAKMYELLGRYQDAVYQYNKVIEIAPHHPEAYFLLARTYIRLGKADEARYSARAGFELDKKAVKDIMELGDILVANGAWAEAVDMFAIALNGEFRLDEIRLKLGDAFEKMGQFERAKEEWDRALEFSDEDEKESVMNRLDRIAQLAQE
ncbi:MAG: tetratricopeptide repeat protein [Candidatus Omnitrophota bacterium]